MEQFIQKEKKALEDQIRAAPTAPDTPTSAKPGIMGDYMLRRLPVWGYECDDKAIDFEWPTQEIFDLQQPDVTLKSLEFCGDKDLIASVKCNLSNGQSSPVFCKVGGKYSESNPKTIEFDSTPIRTVSAADEQDHDFEDGNMHRIKFLDGVGNQVFIYENGYTGQETEHQIRENEELIGVYGVKNKNLFFTSFGFILKVKRQ